MTPAAPSPPTPRLRCTPWNGSTGTRTCASAGRPAPAKVTSARRSGSWRSTPARTVAWFSIDELGALVRRHRADDSISKAIRRIARLDLIIVHDIGMLAVGEDAAEGFYRLVDACYEKRSLAVSSNLHPAGFEELMPKTLATATVDRLLHHAHICVTDGQSFRLAQATTQQRAAPTVLSDLY